MQLRISQFLAIWKKLGDFLTVVANYLQVLGWDEHNTEKSHEEFQPTEPEGFPLP